MSLPSLEPKRDKGISLKPRIYVLGVRDKKKLGEPPVAYIVVERTEKINNYQEKGQVYEASLRLDFEVFTTGRNWFRVSKSFEGGYSKFRNVVSLSSSSAGLGAIFLDLEGLYGQRIGTFLMSEIVAWVKQWPDAEVNPIRLSSVQATSDNKDRRNRFYESFGLEFDYVDFKKKEGRSRPIKAVELKENLKWQQNIEVLELVPFIENFMIISSNKELEIERLKSSIKRLGDENISARDYPIRWALRWTWNNNFHNFVMLIIISLIGLVAWSRWY
ncbi:hypothetical protein [Methylotenera sp.]|uniref:hypothetical protein n=1 Tax=Methylotenera sp. TaxID=2051956 RepID=UPI002486CF0D|nr:hypothetical protein [Methylotenera sp.]MDI1298614.1 hypothetical protein [Methylotenera sp.]